MLGFLTEDMGGAKFPNWRNWIRGGGRVLGSYLIPQALQRAVPSSAFLHMGVFLVQHDAHILSSDG